MAAEPKAGSSPPGDQELNALRERVAELEKQLAEQSARANAAIAAAEDRSYWLDRMRIDMNAVMRTPFARALFSIAQFAGRVWRAVRWRLG